MKNRVLIIEASDIIRRGLKGIIENHLHYDVETTERAGQVIDLHCSTVIINPGVAGLTEERLRQLRIDATNSNVRLLALVYAYFDAEILSTFDDIIFINDTEMQLVSKLRRQPAKDSGLPDEAATLSERELDVLQLVAKGCSNKEIADKLNISIHTSISHRKNITAKLGIKSASGLTIYAIINKLVNPDELYNSFT
ncbi:MAG: response regulator transcription factor [Bacteroidales bacterium]|jgi:DNA-binding NarL/FixJ family response regulator|nr:response regulator transcription factor [Bacteroidales bacterium]